MSSESKIQKRVLEAYESKAKEMLDKGLRGNWWYIASKALSDWALLSKIEINNRLVLNVGCSEPIDEMWLSRKVKAWVAVDISPRSIRAAMKVLRAEISVRLANKVAFVVADATRLCFRNETFDVAVAFSTIEHIPSRIDVIKEMTRVTKSEGYVVVTVPNKWNLTGFFTDSKAMKMGKADYGWQYFYTPFELKKELETCGLQPISFTSNLKVLTFPFPISIVPRILNKGQYFGKRMGYLCRKPKKT